MELTRAYKFRIYPDANRQKEIEMQLNLSKDFYNKLLGYAYKKKTEH
ncbi:MAG: helix-turn-helix domain-containing protein [Conexivisphaerales archaeon]